MPLPLSPRGTLIAAALAGIYSRAGTISDTVTALAADLDTRWDALCVRADENNEPLEHEVMLVIWNWYSGGGTAEIAAKAVLAAVSTTPNGTEVDNYLPCCSHCGCPGTDRTGHDADCAHGCNDAAVIDVARTCREA